MKLFSQENKAALTGPSHCYGTIRDRYHGILECNHFTYT